MVFYVFCAESPRAVRYGFLPNLIFSIFVIKFGKKKNGQHAPQCESWQCSLDKWDVMVIPKVFVASGTL